MKTNILLDNEYRCNNFNCLLKGFCARFRQYMIDYDKYGLDHSQSTVKKIPYDNGGMCPKFLNVDVLIKEK